MQKAPFREWVVISNPKDIGYPSYCWILIVTLPSAIKIVQQNTEDAFYSR